MAETLPLACGWYTGDGSAFILAYQTQGIPPTPSGGAVLYCNQVGGVSQFFVKTPDGTISQLTPALAIPVIVAKGGTGLATLTAHALLVGNGASNPNFLAPGASGNYGVSNGTDWISEAHTPGQASATVAWGADTSEHTLGSASVTVGTSGKTLFLVSCPFNFNMTSSSQITFRMKVDGTTQDTVVIDCVPDANTPTVRQNFAWSEVITGLSVAAHTFSMTVQNTSTGNVGSTSSATGRVTVVPV